MVHQYPHNSAILQWKFTYFKDHMTPEKSQDVRERLRGWLNQSLRIRMTDGRTLIGLFLCTDKDRNVILGSCEEYLTAPDSDQKEEPRVLGLAMVPGQHIVSIEIDKIDP